MAASSDRSIRIRVGRALHSTICKVKIVISITEYELVQQYIHLSTNVTEPDSYFRHS